MPELPCQAEKSHRFRRQERKKAAGSGTSLAAFRRDRFLLIGSAAGNSTQMRFRCSLARSLPVVQSDNEFLFHAVISSYEIVAGASLSPFVPSFTPAPGFVFR